MLDEKRRNEQKFDLTSFLKPVKSMAVTVRWKLFKKPEGLALL